MCLVNQISSVSTEFKVRNSCINLYLRSAMVCHNKMALLCYTFGIIGYQYSILFEAILPWNHYLENQVNAFDEEEDKKDNNASTIKDIAIPLKLTTLHLQDHLPKTYLKMIARRVLMGKASEEYAYALQIYAQLTLLIILAYVEYTFTMIIGKPVKDRREPDSTIGAKAKSKDVYFLF
ncbi:hypothetical protein BD560DRAFT_423060 [Blakeslea trispora]|nr:hypothetical protein BD560DRAFT_423060 [Blakeslea trispora]